MSDMVLDRKAAVAAERQQRTEQARQRRAEELARVAEEQRALGRVRIGGWIQPERKEQAEAMLRALLEDDLPPAGQDDHLRRIEAELEAARSQAEQLRPLREELHSAKQAVAALQSRLAQAEAGATAAEARLGAAEQRAAEATRLLNRPGLRARLGAWLLKG